MPARRVLLAVLLLLAAALLVAACGGSSSSSSPAAPATTATGASAAAADPTADVPSLVGAQDPVLSTKPSAKPDPVSSATRATRGRPPQFGTDKDEGSFSGGDPLDPCSLVTRAEAQAIVGSLAHRRLAPLGPTCVYTPGRRHGRAAAITVSVQAAPVSAAARHSRRTIHLRVQGRAAFCVNAAQLAVLVPLADGRTLRVAAPCPVAARFASAALPRITS